MLSEATRVEQCAFTRSGMQVFSHGSDRVRAVLEVMGVPVTAGAQYKGPAKRSWKSVVSPFIAPGAPLLPANCILPATR